MKIAITTWGNRVSPVFDAAQTLLIADIDNQSIHNKKYESFKPDDITALAALLNREKVTALVCGAISETYAARLVENRIRMHAFVTGNAMDILKSLASDNIIKPAFKMPDIALEKSGFARHTHVDGGQHNAYADPADHTGGPVKEHDVPYK
jgi:predicted Fe-Mo cluster-binding NifX family protein